MVKMYVYFVYAVIEISGDLDHHPKIDSLWNSEEEAIERCKALARPDNECQVEEWPVNDIKSKFNVSVEYLAE